MKIAVVQMAVLPEKALNEKKILSFLAEAYQRGASLVVFPEMALCGYDRLTSELGDLVHQGDQVLVQKIHDYAKFRDMTVLIGGMEVSGGNKYISCYVIGETVDTYRKIHIGQKEGAYVDAGEEIKIFHHKNLTFGIMLCYDGHFPELCQIMAAMGAEIVFNPSASPNRSSDRVHMWQKYLPARAYDNRIWLVANNLLFRGKGGGTAVWNSNGDLVKECLKEEDHMLVTTYTKEAYSSTSMRKRDFKVDRKPHIYDRYRCLNG